MPLITCVINISHSLIPWMSTSSANWMHYIAYWQYFRSEQHNMRFKYRSNNQNMCSSSEAGIQANFRFDILVKLQLLQKFLDPPLGDGQQNGWENTWNCYARYICAWSSCQNLFSSVSLPKIGYCIFQAPLEPRLKWCWWALSVSKALGKYPLSLRRLGA